MVDPVEELLQVYVEGVPVTFLDVVLGRLDRLVGTPARPEAVTGWNFGIPDAGSRAWVSPLGLSLALGVGVMEGAFNKGEGESQRVSYGVEEETPSPAIIFCVSKGTLGSKWNQEIYMFPGEQCVMVGCLEEVRERDLAKIRAFSP